MGALRNSHKFICSDINLHGDNGRTLAMLQGNLIRRYNQNDRARDLLYRRYLALNRLLRFKQKFTEN